MFGIWTARACPSLRRLCGGSAASAAVVDDSFKSRGVLGSLPTNRTAGRSCLSSAAIPACNHLQRFLHAIPQLSHAWVQDLTVPAQAFSLKKIEFGRSLSKIEFTLAFTREIIRAIMDPLRSAIPKCLSQRGRRDLKHPSNSQLRSLCHGLLYYGGHAVVAWLKGAGGHCMSR